MATEFQAMSRALTGGGHGRDEADLLTRFDVGSSPAVIAAGIAPRVGGDQPGGGVVHGTTRGETSPRQGTVEY